MDSNFLDYVNQASAYKGALYHITTREVATKYIKKEGLQTYHQRTGKTSSDPNGTTARAAAEDRSKAFKHSIAVYLKSLYTRTKCVPSVAVECVFNEEYIEYSVAPSEDASAGSIEASRLKAERVKTYFDLVSKTVQNAATGAAPKQQEYESHAGTILLNPSHFLTMLAKNDADVRDKLEDYQTCRHNYFFSERTEKSAKDLYSLYTPKFGETPLVVLRIVDSQRVGNLHQDPSEVNGLRTLNHIPAYLFEVMEEHKDFVLDHYRKNDKNWKPLSELL